MIHLHERIFPDPAGIEPATSWSPVGRASDWANEAGLYELEFYGPVNTIRVMSSRSVDPATPLLGRLFFF